MAGASVTLTPSPALAGCDIHKPVDGQTVTCTDVPPNPDDDGVINTSNTGNNITVNVLDGAEIRPIIGLDAIVLGSNARVDIAGTVTVEADPADPNYPDSVPSGVRTKEEGTVIVRGTGLIEATDAEGVSMTGGHLEVEQGGRIKASGLYATAIVAESRTDDLFTATIAGVVEAVGKADAIEAGFGVQIEVTETGEVLMHGGWTSAGAITAGAGSTILLGGRIESEGRGISVEGGSGGGSTIILSSSAEILALSNRSYGIEAIFDGHVISVAGTVTTTGERAPGVYARGSANSVTIAAGGSIVTQGDKSHGILIEDGSGNVVQVDGTIETRDPDAIGVFSGGSFGNVDGTTVIVSGTISSAGRAIDLSEDSAAEVNRVELRPGFEIVGQVVGAPILAYYPEPESFNDQLVLGGDGGADSFDVSLVSLRRSDVHQYIGFGVFEKTGGSTWTLTGANSDIPAFEVLGGTLLANAQMPETSFTVRRDATLGGTGTVENILVNGGGMLAPGGVGAIGTLTTGGTLVLDPSSVLHVDLGRSAGVPIGDLIKVGTTLTLDGGYVDIADAGGFGTGVYTLIEYGGLMVLSGTPVVRTNPDGSLTYAVSTTTSSGPSAGEMRLTVSGGAGGNIQYWDANGATAGAQGGTGVWDANNTNWIDNGGGANVAWGSQFAVFDGTPGVVTVEGSQTFTGMQFLKNYTITAGADGVLDAGSGATIRVNQNSVATLDIGITGGPIVKLDPGKLILAAATTYGPATVRDGVLELAGTSILDGGTGAGVTFDATALDDLTWVEVGENATLRGSNAVDASTANGAVAVLVRGTMDGNVLLGNSGDVFQLRPTAVLSANAAINGRGGADSFEFWAEPGEIGTFTHGTTATLSSFEEGYMGGGGTWTVNGTGSIASSKFRLDSGTLVYNLNTPNLAMDIVGYSRLAGSGALGAVKMVLGTNNVISPGNGGTGAAGGVGVVGTMQFASLVLHEEGALDFDLGRSGGASIGDLIEVTGDLTLTGTLNINDIGGFGNGDYTLINYGSLHANSTGLVVGTRPDLALDYEVQHGATNAGPGVVLLHVTGGAAGDSQYWDGSNMAGSGVPGGAGGTGTWNGDNTNWTNQAGANPAIWGEQFAIFGGSGDPAVVTVEGQQIFTGMQFKAGGYSIGSADANARLVAGITDTRIGVDADLSASVSSQIEVDAGKTLIKEGAGRLGLGGPNAYSGATIVNAGTLSAITANTFSANSAHTVAAGAVLSLINADSQSNDQTIGSLAGNGSVLLGSATLTAGGDGTSTTFGGVIAGDGGLTKAGIGTLTLTGANTYTGLTTIDRGTLSLGNGGVGGSIVGDIFNDNNFLVFNRSDNVTYAGVLSGTGSTGFVGSGMTTLTGDSSGLTGPAFVTAGNLRIAPDGSLGTSLLTVGTDGTLSGRGSIVGNVSVEGRLAPGADALGTFTITGDVEFETGSIYAIRIAGTNPDPSPAATVDSLSVGGTADLTGGTVEIAAIDPRTSYVDGHTYATAILTAAGGLGETEFADVGMASDSAFITPTLSYIGNDVFLTIAVTRDFGSVAETFNQFQAATALNDLEQAGDALAVFNTIAAMNPDEARLAFDLTSGEAHAAGQHLIDQTFALFNRTLRYQGVSGVGSGNVGAQVFSAPLGYGPAVAAGNAGVVAIEDAATYATAHMGGAWAAPLGGFGHIDGDGNAAKLNWWNTGLAGGYEGVIDVAAGSAVGGFGFGYIHSGGTLDERLSTFDADGFYLGAYGAWADGPWTMAGSLSYGANSVSTERTVAFMGTSAEADYWTHAIGASLKASYAFDLADTTKLAPLFTLDAGWSGHGGFTETGAGALNLTSGPQSWTRLDAGLGIALTHTILTESGTVTLEGRAVWEHAFADMVPSQSLALAGSPTGFTVLGPDAGRDWLHIGAGLAWDVSDDITLRARYDGLFANSQTNHSAALGINIRF